MKIKKIFDKKNYLITWNKKSSLLLDKKNKTKFKVIKNEYEEPCWIDELFEPTELNYQVKVEEEGFLIFNSEEAFFLNNDFSIIEEKNLELKHVLIIKKSRSVKK